jgi:hypothetical protein
MLISIWKRIESYNEEQSDNIDKDEGTSTEAGTDSDQDIDIDADSSSTVSGEVKGL